MRNTANPKIKQYTDQRTGTARYLVRYRKPDGKQTKKRGFLRKIDAERWLSETEAAMRQGFYVQPSLARTTVGALAGTWKAGKQATVKPSTYADAVRTWRLHVAPHFEDRTVGSIRQSEVTEWLAAIPGSASLHRQAHTVLAQILDVAVRDHLLPVNPARGVRLPKATRSEQRFLSHAEVARLAEASGRHRPLVLLLAYGGLRWGEAVALRGRDVQGQRVAVNRAARRVDGVWVVGPPKTHQRRTVVLPHFVADLLTSEGEDDLLFPARSGGFMSSPSRERGWWGEALRAAGLPRMRVHDLRHTAASLAVQSGASVKAVQRMLGHESAAVTLDVYAGLWDSDLEDVAARLEVSAGHALGTFVGDDESRSGIVGVVR